MFDRKVEQPSFGMHDGTTVKIFRHGIGIESRRHDHDSQIGPRPLQALQQCQREIAFEVALMKFIEHHSRHPLQERIGKQPPREYALSDESQPRARGNRFFKPDLISDSLSDRFAELPRQLDAPPAAPQSGAVRVPPLRRSRFQAARAVLESSFPHPVRL